MTDALEAPRLYPTFRYRDADAAIAWLTQVIGFRPLMRHPAEGPVEHAELSLGSAIIMLGQDRDDAFCAIVGHPGTASGSALYVAVDDVDALHSKVAASTATILEKPTDRPYGSREFICRDAEGYVWSFGSYWPKA